MSLFLYLVTEMPSSRHYYSA